MELRGVRFDIDYFKKLNHRIEKELVKLEKDFCELTGKTNININSPDQISNYLFNELKLKSVKKTPKIQDSVDEESLLKLREKYYNNMQIVCIIDVLHKYREVSKIKNTYLDSFYRRLDLDGKFRTDFNQVGTVSGRFTAKPTLQTLPRNKNYNIRKLFIPEEGNTCIIADYQQMELRLAAAISGDKVMFNALKENKDLHELTAKNIYKTESPTKEQRYNAKQLNFAVLYGAMENQVARLTNQTKEESKQHIKSFYNLYKGFAEWKRKIEYQIEQTQKCKTPFGRTRNIDISSIIPPWKQKRSMLNSIIQGAGADILKLSMVKIYENIEQKGLGFLLSTLHDELIVECKEEKKKEVFNIMKNCMEFTLKEMPLPVDIIYSKSFSKE